MDNDHKIIKAIQSKHPKAFDMIYDRYAGPLNGLIVSICKDQGQAQDIIQDVFIKIWNNLSTWDPEKARLFTWMYAIARNAALDAGKKQKNKKLSNLSEADGLRSGFSVEDRLAQKELMEQLSLLEEKYRVVIEGLFVEGMTQRELSKEKEIPLGTVKSRLHVGLRKLRKLYKDPVIIILTMIIRNILNA